MLNTDLSPAQIDRIDGLQARFPSTTFEVVSVDALSCYATIEADDLEGFSVFSVTAAGLNVPERVSARWAS